MPSFSGAFGILPAHVPSLAVLKPGVVTVYENDGATKKFFVSSGSVTINEDSSVQILAEEAHALADIDAAAARQVVAEATAAVNAAGDEVLSSVPYRYGRYYCPLAVRAGRVPSLLSRLAGAGLSS